MNSIGRSVRWTVAAAAMILLAGANEALGLSEAADLIGLSGVRIEHPLIDGVDNATGQVQRVAIIDTGIDHDHPDLIGRVVAGYNYGGDATRDSSLAQDFDDGHGHGTSVTGIIGSGRSNLLGVAPKVEFVSVRVLDDSGSGSFFDIARGMEWVVANAAALNITTVNLSLGSNEQYARPQDVVSYSAYTRIRDAAAQLEAMDVITVAASGNNGSKTGLSVPAIFEQTISVGATTEADQVWSQTNRNAELDLLAPGVTITSLTKNGRTSTGNGTSFAAPMVAGVAVLLREVYETFTDDLAGGYASFQDRLTDLLRRTGDPVYDSKTGRSYARINVDEALASVFAEFGYSETTVPEPASMTLLCIGALAMLPVCKRGA